MIATDTIPQNTVIINCPGDLALSQEGHASQDTQCDYIETIIEHLKAGEESKWFKYFDFDDSLGSRIPSEWRDGSQALDELQGLPPTGETHRHINWYKNSCKQGRDVDQWEMRAFKIFLTRAADIGLIPMYGKLQLVALESCNMLHSISILNILFIILLFSRSHESPQWSYQYPFGKNR